MASTSLDDTQVDDTDIVEPPEMRKISSSPGKRKREVKTDIDLARRYEGQSEITDPYLIALESELKKRRILLKISSSPDKCKREVEISVKIEELIKERGELEQKIRRASIENPLVTVEQDVYMTEPENKQNDCPGSTFRDIKSSGNNLKEESNDEMNITGSEQMNITEMLKISSSPDKWKRQAEIDVEIEELIKEREEVRQKIRRVVPVVTGQRDDEDDDDDDDDDDHGESGVLKLRSPNRSSLESGGSSSLDPAKLIKQSGGTKSNIEANEVKETHVIRFNDNYEPSFNVELQLLRSVLRGDYNSLCSILSTISENDSVSEKSFKIVLDVSVSLRNREITNRLLNFASELLKRKSSGQIQDAWPAYEETSVWTPVFVVTYLSILRFPEDHYLGYRILWRKCDDVSNEGSIVANSAEVRDNPLSYDEMIDMKKLIRKADLFKRHKKIAIVNACPCKSRNGGKDISLEKCIVIYTPIKGFIPFDEQPFRKSIDGVPVDVREAYVKLGMLSGKVRPHHDRQQSHTVNDTDDKSCPTPTSDARYSSSAHRQSFSDIPETSDHNKNICKQLLPDTALGMDGLYNNIPHDSTANYSDTESVVKLASRDDTTTVQSSLQQSSLEEPMNIETWPYPQDNVGENMNIMQEVNTNLPTAAAIGPLFGHVNPTLQKSTAMPICITKTAADEHSLHFMDANTKSVQVLPNRAKTGRDFNEKLLMGTEIGLYGFGLRGTLGAFVPLPNGDVGALTCAHVMGVFHGHCDEDVSQIVTQPSCRTSLNNPYRFKIGHLYKAVFAQGCCDDVSIDAAIIKVESRRPEKAEFIDTETLRLKTAGFDPSQPPSFTKGQILKSDQLRPFMRNQVIKYGSQSSLTQGVISMLGSDVRLVGRSMMLPNKTDVEVFNQIEILSVTGCTNFFEGGDSGSLVFMPLGNVPELYCIGLAVGWTSYGSCIVTPIENVLKKLGLPDKFIDFSNS